MKQLILGVMSILILLLVTFNFYPPTALAQGIDELSISEQTTTLEKIEQSLETIKLLMLSTQGDQPEPTEGENQESLSSRQSLNLQTVNQNSLNNFRARIDSWAGLPNFSGGEITQLLYNRCGTTQNSVPPSNIWNNIAPTLAVLQRLRNDLGAPIHLTSVYRSPEYNRCIGGAPNSYHSIRSDNNSKSMTAIDFYAETGSSSDWRAKLRSYRGQSFTNPATGSSFIFAGGIGKYATFTHVDTRGDDVNF